MEDIYLNDLWSFFFHDPFDSDWNISSYKKVQDIGSIKEYWNIQKSFENHVHNGMFFLMREHIFPCWDDPLNKNGGCLSIKVIKQDVDFFWKELSMCLLGETLLVDEKSQMYDCVNGISTSPKKNFCIIKIWLRNSDLASKIFFNIPPGYYGDILYKSNSENIGS